MNAANGTPITAYATTADNVMQSRTNVYVLNAVKKTECEPENTTTITEKKT